MGFSAEQNLFKDLELIKNIEKKKEELPFLYNYSGTGGYFNMPSARFPDTGMAALGFAYVPPYRNFNATFQLFSHLELSGDYRVFHGITEGNFGAQGFGDDLDRGANLKLALYKETQNIPYLPSFAVGLDDFYGSRRFHSFYIAATKQWQEINLETTFGWSKGRIHGFYGGLAWTPFRNSTLPILPSFSLVAEYDAINYAHYAHEHPQGRSVKIPINVGLSAKFFQLFELQVSSLRGEEIAAAVHGFYNIGQTAGIIPKVDNPPIYTAPIDTEPIGYLREERQFADEMTHALAEQGLFVQKMLLFHTEQNKRGIWLKVINSMYRSQREVKERLEYLLSMLIPSNIDIVQVEVESDGIPILTYHFSEESLNGFREQKKTLYELSMLSVATDPSSPPDEYESQLLYERKKAVWKALLRPRAITFFGSTTGKFKYTVGLLGGPEGYLRGDVYYKIQASYNINSSFSDAGEMDVLNPSQLPNVRSDTLSYYKSNSVSLEQAFLQKSVYLGKSWYARTAIGYFEPAYGGAALEFLYAPLHSSWAIGFEADFELKRKYTGVAFTTTVRKFDGFTPTFIHFIGYQYFLDFYYEFRPLQLEAKISVGSFLARDKGARFELARYFKSGMRFGMWYTVTNGHDHVNGKLYFDKGVMFSIPLDMFLKRSSRSEIGYAMSFWLRDVGARALSGKRLYTTIAPERFGLQQ